MHFGYFLLPVLRWSPLPVLRWRWNDLYIHFRNWGGGVDQSERSILPPSFEWTNSEATFGVTARCYGYATRCGYIDFRNWGGGGLTYFPALDRKPVPRFFGQPKTRPPRRNDGGVRLTVTARGQISWLRRAGAAPPLLGPRLRRGQPPSPLFDQTTFAGSWLRSAAKSPPVSCHASFFLESSSRTGCCRRLYRGCCNAIHRAGVKNEITKNENPRADR